MFNGSTDSVPLKELHQLLSWYDANVLSIRDETVPRVVAKGVYLSASLFNHSCDPNCVISYEQGACVSIRCIRSVAIGEELCVAYVDTALPYHVRQAQLRYSDTLNRSLTPSAESRHYRHFPNPRPTPNSPDREQWHFSCSCTKCTSAHSLSNDRLVHGLFCADTTCCSLLTSVDQPADQSVDPLSPESSIGSGSGPSLSLRGVSTIPYGKIYIYIIVPGSIF